MPIFGVCSPNIFFAYLAKTNAAGSQTLEKGTLACREGKEGLKILPNSKLGFASEVCSGNSFQLQPWQHWRDSAFEDGTEGLSLSRPKVALLLAG